jgi:hypothetical protein
MKEKFLNSEAGMNAIMDEKPKRKNWKGIASLLIWIGIMQMLTNSFPFYGFRVGLAISPFFANAFVNVAACFGLLCAVSAIRTERMIGQIFGGIAVLLWFFWFADWIDLYFRYYARHGFH